ncbi:MAG: serine protease Do [Blastocatellia bacterium]|jgi:serine protease Do|nr:serine protease Do [Blastocatellia bacterium]
MFDRIQGQPTDAERTVLHKLRVWIAALAIACLLMGVGIGAMLAGRPAVAQSEAQIARAPEALSASFAEIAKRVEPAVVNIDTLTAAPNVAEKDNEDKEDQTPNNPLFDMFRRQAQRPARGVGSGFIVDPKGYILTNEHVIEGATRITIGLQSGEKLRGQVVGIDHETDLAVIKVESPRDLPTVKLGDSNGAQVGDWVLAIGSPFGLEQTVTAGIISKKERESQFFTSFQRFLQTDAAINRGNSGGPLVNMRGEVIGVNSQIATSTGDYNGIGFALPANEAGFVYRQLVSGGKVKRGYLGITLDSVRAEFARVYGLSDARGAIVADVQAGEDGKPTPAAKAGIQSNDVIIEFEGQPVQDANDLIARVASTPVGQNVTLTLLRDVDGKLDKRTVTVMLGDRSIYLPRRAPDLAPPVVDKESSLKGNTLKLGITLGELTAQLVAERHLGGVKGLYVKEVDPNGIAADARPYPVREREVVTRINRVPVNSLADFQRVLSALKPGDAIVLNLTRFDEESGKLAQRIVQFTYQ